MAHDPTTLQAYTTRAVCFLSGSAIGFRWFSRTAANMDFGPIREFVWLENSLFSVATLEEQCARLFALYTIDVQIGPGLLFARSLQEREIQLVYEEEGQVLWGLYMRRDQRGDSDCIRRVNEQFS